MLRRLTAEFIGTLALVCVVVGSGIMAERLSGGNDAIALLANTISTGAGLFCLIIALGDVSGAHFNPVVSLSAAIHRDLSVKELIPYLIVQIAGGALGAVIANLMFSLPAVILSTKVRTGPAQWLGEAVATFGLLGVIICVSRRNNLSVVAAAVALYVTAAYWFTSSTSFANPAVTIARSLTDTFTGIRPADVLPFIVTQTAAAIFATYFFNWLVPENQ